MTRFLAFYRGIKRFFAIFSGSMKTGILNYLGDEVWLEIPGRRVLPQDTEE